MSKTNLFETGFLNLLFRNEALANVGNAGGLQPSGAAGSLFVALFTTPTGEDSEGTEATYAGYARQSIDRTAVDWDVTDNVASNVNNVAFPQATAGNDTVTHYGIMTSLEAGDMLFHGALGTARLINAGTSLIIEAGNLTVTEN